MKPFKITMLNKSLSSLPLMDGCSLISYNGVLNLWNGWNPANVPDITYNTHYTSIDGITFTKQADAPWLRRHTAICLEKDNKIWMMLGDDINTIGFQIDCWTYDTTNGYVQVTDDMGPIVGKRGGASGVVLGDYIYLLGGQYTNNGSEMATDMIRSTDGINWEVVCQLPIDHFAYGVAFIYNGRITFTGGGQFRGYGSSFYNDKTYSWDCEQWRIVCQNPSDMRGIFQNTASLNDVQYLLMGGRDLENQYGLYYLKNNTWEWFGVSCPPRHASGFCGHHNGIGEAMYIVTGNMWNDSWKIRELN